MFIRLAPWWRFEPWNTANVWTPKKKGRDQIICLEEKSKNDWLNTTVSRFVTGVVRLVANELFQPFASQSLYIFQCEQGSWICGRKQQSWRRKLCAHSLAKYRRLPSSIPLHRHEHLAGEPATMPFKKNFNSFYSDSIAITPVSSDDMGQQIVCKIDQNCSKIEIDTVTLW